MYNENILVLVCHFGPNGLFSIQAKLFYWYINTQTI